MNRNQRTVARCALALGAVFTVAGGLWLAGYRYNETESLPTGVWQITAVPPASLHHGDIVHFCPPNTPALIEAKQRGYLRGGPCGGDLEPMFKPIIGLPGDSVQLGVDGVSVNGTTVANSTPLLVDGRGEPMPTLQGTFRVVDGTAWVVSSYTPYSFDSRYFGPIALDSINGTARPVWLREQADTEQVSP